MATQYNYPYDNDIVVEIDGKAHSNWKSYDIDSDFLIPADAFNFDIGTPANHTVLPDLSGKEVRVKINGQIVLTGIVDATQHQISKNSRTFSLNGRDRASILVDCSAPTTNVKGLTVLDAIKKIVAPIGIKKIELRAKDNNPVIDKIDIEPSETAWSAALRCANFAGLHLWFDPNGTLIVGGPDYRSPPVATLCCQKDGWRNNFEQAQLTYDISQSFSEVTFLAQKHGRSHDDNKNNLKWVWQDKSVKFYRPKTVVIHDAEDLESLKKHAKKYLSDAALNAFTLTIIVPDHKTENGVLWQPGQRVHVICEEYDIDAIFFVMGRRFTLSRSQGTQTELRLKQDGIWIPDAFREHSKRARKRKGKKAKELIQLRPSS